LGISITEKEIFAVNPVITPNDYIAGRVIFIPLPGSDRRPLPPPAVPQETSEESATAPDNPVDGPPAVSPDSPDQQSAPTDEAYVVRSGDTLATIAKQFGLPIHELMEANGLNSLSLKIGQTLLIPSQTR
jgi:LysM repeat protein